MLDIVLAVSTISSQQETAMKSSLFTFLLVALAAMTYCGSATAESTDVSRASGDPASYDYRRSFHAVTLWWVIFNEPENCVTSPEAAVRCGGVDIFGEKYLESVANGAPDPGLIRPNLEAGLAVVYATGGITSWWGRVRLVASLYQGESGEDLPDTVDPMNLNKALTDSNAEIHLVVRDHGRRHPRDYESQISAFLDPYCSDPNLLYFAGPNLCQDVQFAVFAPDQDGDASVFSFADPTRPLRRARARLTRGAGTIQAIVETTLR